MNRALILALTLLLSGSVALATGFGGEGPVSRIPHPARSFHAEIVDRAGVKHQVKEVSINGEIYLYGSLGKAQISVPFDSIRLVTFNGEQAADDQKATVETVDGVLNFTVDGDLPCYGRNGFGNYKIEVRDIRTVRFFSDKTD